ncbi:MAG: hypothetical protein IJ840_02215 [Bacteroidales bacterium]|nr:hypothetical protein [Bacteroidales bacterium]
MKKWEDIIKDKLEDTNDTLPESLFAEFQSRRDGLSSAPSRKRSPLLWMLAPAVAAGLAAVLLLRVSPPQDNMIQIVESPVMATRTLTEHDTPHIPEPQVIPDMRPTFRAVADARAGQAAREDITSEDAATEKGDAEESGAGEPKAEVSIAKEPVVNEYPLAVPARQAFRIKFAPAAGVIAGGGLLAALAGSFGTKMAGDLEIPGYYSSDVLAPNNPPDPQDPKDKLVGKASHHVPLKAGLSLSFPVGGNLSVTSGVDYSRFVSRFHYSLSGEKTQVAHYIGVPVRLDWTFTSWERLDAYIGAGLEGDYCLGATFGGDKIKGDGFSLSVVGTAGLMINLSRHVGLYVEPGLNWAMPSGRRVLETYRTGHPVSFSASGGLRFNLGR